MSLTFLQKGSRLPYPNSGSAIASGDVVVLRSGATTIGLNVGIALDAIIATTGTGTLSVGGVHSLTANTGETGSIGDLIYWDASAKKLTSVSTANTLAGFLWKARVSADTTAEFLLNGMPSTT